MNWYETTGQAHLRHFFGLINQTIRHGKDNGLQVKEIDLGDAMKIYRGENLVNNSERNYKSRVTLEVIHEIQALHRQGLTQQEIADKHGISRTYVNDIIHKRRRRVI